MKTDDLITLVSKDLTTPAPVGATISRWLLIGIAASALGFALLLGFRAGLDEGAVMLAVSVKVIAALILAMTGCVAAVRLASPGIPLRNILPALLIAPAFLAAFMALDLLTLGLSGLPGRIMGKSALRCLVVIPLLGALPLAAFLVALRNGAASRPVAAGASAGLAAAGIAAGMYAFNCGDDSPLFVFVWYGLAALLLAGIGALAGRRTLTW